MTLPVALSIPHGGSRVPKDLSDRVILSDKDVFEDGDSCTREIFDVGDAVLSVIESDVARSIVDLNRDPSALPETVVDGVVKHFTCFGKRIYKAGREPDASTTERLLQHYYHPYHARLSEISQTPEVQLVLDCHSMLSKAPPIAADAGAERPPFCVSDGNGTTASPSISKRVADAIAQAFECSKDEVLYNEPFQGGFIVRKYGGGKIPWVQIEMNRSWYLDEEWHDPAELWVDPARLAFLRERFLRALTIVFSG